MKSICDTMQATLAVKLTAFNEADANDCDVKHILRTCFSHSQPVDI